MKPRSLVIYAAVFLAALLFYYVYEVRIQAEKRAEEAAEAAVYDLTYDKVGGAVYVNGGERYVLAAGGPTQWKILAPRETQADRWAVEGMIRRVLKAEKERVFDEPVEDQAQFGLDKPSISLELYSGPPEDDASRRLAPAIHVGKKNPAGMLYYCRLGDSQEIFTINADVRREMDKSFFDLRDKSLVLFPGEKMEKIRFTLPENILLERQGIRTWDILEPEPGPADDDVVQRVIYRALKGDATKFAPLGGEDRDFGFDDPLARLEVMDEEGAVVAEVVVGSAEEAPSDSGEAGEKRVQGYWARTSERDEAMLIEEKAALALAQTYDAIRDRGVLTLERDGLTGLTIAADRKTLRAEKTEGVWEVVEPSGAESTDFEIDSFLMDLEDMKYVRRIEEGDRAAAEYGLDDPDLTLKLTGPEDRTTALAASYGPFEDGLMAVRVDDGPVDLVNRDAFIANLPSEIRAPQDGPEAAEPDKDGKEG